MRETGSRAVAPIGEEHREATLEVVRAVWERMLHRDDLELDENFFDAGGSSLQLMRMHAELNRHFPGSCTVIDLFSASTIEKMAECIDAKLKRALD